MSIDNITTIAPLSELLPKEKFPLLQYFPQEMQKKIFNDLYFSDSLVYDDAGIVHAAFVLHHKGAIEIPSLDNDLFQIQLGKKDDRGKWYSFNVDISLDINEPAITFEDIGITLFVSDSIIRDKESNKRGRISTNCSLTFSGSGITFDFMKETSLLPAYLFDTDIIVEADSLAFQHDNGNFEGMSISKLRTKVPLDFLTIEGWHNKYLDFVLENVSITKKRLTVQARIDANDIAFPSNTSLSQLPLTFREVGVDIFENEFIEFLLGFEMRMFFLEQVNHPNNILMGIELGKEKEIKVQSKKDEPLLFNLGSDNTLTIDELLGSGSINDDGLDIEAICNSTLKLFGKTYTAEQDLLNYKHTQTTEYFKLGFKNLKFELFGNKELENVSFELHLKKEDEEYLVDTMNFSTSLKWKDIKELIDGNPLNIPDEGKIDAELSFNETDSGTQVIVSLITEFSHLDNLWDFIPDDFKPEVRKCNSTFKLTYDSVNDFQNNPDNVTVELSAKIELKLPDLNAFQIPGFDLIKVTTGDEEGFVTAEYTANYVSDNSEESFNCGMTLTDAFSVDLAMPGTSAENPLVHSTLDKIALKFEDKEQGETQTIGGEILFEGEFEFRPLVPLDFPFASQFNALLHQIGMDDIKGNTKLSLAFDEESFDFEFNGTFEHLGIDVDIFQMLNSLAGSGNVQAENEVQIKFDIGFFLTGFTVHIAQDKDKETQVSFKLDLECSMTGLPPVKAEIELSNEAFSFGITDLSIPLEVPEYPIDIEDLERLQNNDGIWSLEDGTDGKAYIAELEDKKLRLSNLLNIDETTDSGIDRKRVQKDLSHIELKKVMLELIMQVHKLALPAGGDVQPFQTMVETDTWVRSSTLNLLHVDTNLVLNFPEIKFHIPFNNPAGISISGAGKLLGFGEKDALKGLEDLTFKLGLSAEYIFAQIESSGEAIPIPSFGSKYNDGSFSIGKFMIGYGYTKNSFAFDVAGELIIPTKMIADANTSERLGFGIKLPRNNKVSFKLDTIIVQAGPITVPIPLPMFDIDLRTPSAPDITSTQRCTPYWDGLEIIGKNIFHTDFKRLAFSPLFGLSFIPNIKFDADLQIGDANNGLTLVYNDLLIFLGAPYPVPFLFDPNCPFFKNICANLRVEGFELNFNLERPFPSPSPLVLLEVFALLSNPMMKIDPQGELANIIRFSLTDAYLTVPDFVLQMFPETANFTNKRYGFTLNLGTLITMLQSTAQFMQPVIEKSEAFINDSDKNLNDWMASLPQTFSPWEWIALLPPELRKFRTGGSIAGFDASACLVIATDEEAKKSFTTRNTRERKTLEPMQIQESDSIGVIRFTKDSTPKYKPTSCYDFQNVWIAEGIDGEWECHDKMISQQKKLSGIAYLIYQKEIPENIAISIQLDALLKSERESIGLVFCYQNKNNYYLLRISIDENNQTSIVLERKKSGHFLPEPLVNKPIGKTAQVSETFELLTYLEKDRRVMILNRSISYRDRTDTTSSKKVQTKQIAHVSDESSLENGKVGLYAKYLEKASFEEMTITELKIEKIKNKEIEADSFNNGYKLNYRHSELNHHRLVEKNESDVLFKGKEFKKFDESFLDKLPIGRLLNTNESTGSIFIGAHINVFEAQKYRFFGKLYQNGSFALISENETKPIRLKVLGIDATLPFKGYSNFILAGKQKRDGYDGYLEADGYSDWSPVPNIVRIEIGRKDDLASLKLYSKGTFAITANTKITLFNGEGIIKGTVDISNSHIMFDGTLKYTLGKSLISSGNSYKFQDILSLDIKGKGGLADLGRYYYTGHGTVKFLGIQQAKTDVEINNHYASFRLKFQKDKNSSSALLNKFNVLKDATILLDAEAKVNIRRTVRPEFELNGNGSISLYGATINGSGSVISRPSKSKRLKDDFFELKMQGDLLWHGRKWLGGAMKIGSKGFEVSGSTQFNIDIKLDNNTGIEIPQLFFEINLDGQLSLDAYGKNPKFAYSGHWAIGIKLPDNGNNDNRQIFYLATNTFKFSQKNKLDVSDEYGIKILDVNGFNYLPFGDIEIPVPNINAPERRKALVTYGYTNSKKDDNGNTVGTGPLAIAFPVAPNMPGLQFPRSSNPFDLNNIENLLPKLLLNENYEKDMDKRVKGIYFDYKNIFSPADYKISFNTIQLSDFEIYLMIDNAVAEGFPLKLQIRYGNNHEQHQDIVFNK